MRLLSTTRQALGTREEGNTLHLQSHEVQSTISSCQNQLVTEPRCLQHWVFPSPTDVKKCFFITLSQHPPTDTSYKQQSGSASCFHTRAGTHLPSLDDCITQGSLFRQQREIPQQSNASFNYRCPKWGEVNPTWGVYCFYSFLTRFGFITWFYYSQVNRR